jgi:hypothetical protein
VVGQKNGQGRKVETILEKGGNMEYFTLPTENFMEEAEQRTPPFMHPNRLPHAVVGVRALSAEQCHAILTQGMTLDPYRFGSCGAETREYPLELPKELLPIVAFAEVCNERYWQFDLDDEPMSWLQTYYKGGDYHIHTDSDLGQSRKLTAVAMLSSTRAYQGGTLELLPTGEHYSTPKYLGTIVVFPSWIPHRVTPITEGIRQTINLGFFGPPFR